MKERITLRLYQDPAQQARHDSGAYHPSDDVCGWDYDRGDQVPITDSGGGFLFAVIDHIDRTVRADDTGPYKLATAWTQD